MEPKGHETCTGVWCTPRCAIGKIEETSPLVEWSVRRVGSDQKFEAWLRLLRLSRKDAREPWQIVVKNIETGEEYPFATLDRFFEFLNERLNNTRN